MNLYTIVSLDDVITGTKLEPSKVFLENGLSSASCVLWTEYDNFSFSDIKIGFKSEHFLDIVSLSVTFAGREFSLY